MSMAAGPIYPSSSRPKTSVVKKFLLSCSILLVVVLTFVNIEDAARPVETPQDSKMWTTAVYHQNSTTAATTNSTAKATADAIVSPPPEAELPNASGAIAVAVSPPLDGRNEGGLHDQDDGRENIIPETSIPPAEVSNSAGLSFRHSSDSNNATRIVDTKDLFDNTRAQHENHSIATGIFDAAYGAANNEKGVVDETGLNASSRTGSISLLHKNKHKKVDEKITMKMMDNRTSNQGHEGQAGQAGSVEEPYSEESGGGNNEVLEHDETQLLQHDSEENRTGGSISLLHDTEGPTKLLVDEKNSASVSGIANRSDVEVPQPDDGGGDRK